MHSALDCQTAFECLKRQLPDIKDEIRYVVPIMLDKVAVELGPWSGYNVLAPYQSLINSLKNNFSHPSEADFVSPKVDYVQPKADTEHIG